jgi:hypothetical protein
VLLLYFKPPASFQVPTDSSKIKACFIKSMDKLKYEACAESDDVNVAVTDDIHDSNASPVEVTYMGIYDDVTVEGFSAALPNTEDIAVTMIGGADAETGDQNTISDDATDADDIAVPTQLQDAHVRLHDISNRSSVNIHTADASAVMWSADMVLEEVHGSQEGVNFAAAISSILQSNMPKYFDHMRDILTARCPASASRSKHEFVRRLCGIIEETLPKLISDDPAIEELLRNLASDVVEARQVLRQQTVNVVARATESLIRQMVRVHYKKYSCRVTSATIRPAGPVSETGKKLYNFEADFACLLQALIRIFLVAPDGDSIARLQEALQLIFSKLVEFLTPLNEKVHNSKSVAVLVSKLLTGHVQEGLRVFCAEKTIALECVKTVLETTFDVSKFDHGQHQSYQVHYQRIRNNLQYRIEQCVESQLSADDIQIVMYMHTKALHTAEKNDGLETMQVWLEKTYYKWIEELHVKHPVIGASAAHRFVLESIFGGSLCFILDGITRGMRKVHTLGPLEFCMNTVARTLADAEAVFSRDMLHMLGKHELLLLILKAITNTTGSEMPQESNEYLYLVTLVKSTRIVRLWINLNDASDALVATDEQRVSTSLYDQCISRIDDNIVESLSKKYPKKSRAILKCLVTENRDVLIRNQILKVFDRFSVINDLTADESTSKRSIMARMPTEIVIDKILGTRLGNYRKYVSSMLSVMRRRPILIEEKFLINIHRKFVVAAAETEDDYSASDEHLSNPLSQLPSYLGYEYRQLVKTWLLNNPDNCVEQASETVKSAVRDMLISPLKELNLRPRACWFPVACFDNYGLEGFVEAAMSLCNVRTDLDEGSSSNPLYDLLGSLFSDPDWARHEQASATTNFQAELQANVSSVISNRLYVDIVASGRLSLQSRSNDAETGSPLLNTSPVDRARTLSDSSIADETMTNTLLSTLEVSLILMSSEKTQQKLASSIMKTVDTMKKDNEIVETYRLNTHLPPDLPAVEGAVRAPEAPQGVEGFAEKLVLMENIIWIDKNVSNEENAEYANTLRGKFPQLVLFDDLEGACKYVRDNILCTFTVIVAGSMTGEAIPRLSEGNRASVSNRFRLANIGHVHIFCRDRWHRKWQAEYPGLVDSVNLNIEELLKSIESCSKRLSCFLTLDEWEFKREFCLALVDHPDFPVRLSVETAVESFISLKSNYNFVVDNGQSLNFIRHRLLGIFSKSTNDLESAKEMLRLYTEDGKESSFYAVVNKCFLECRKNHDLLGIANLVSMVVAAMVTVDDHLRPHRIPTYNWPYVGVVVYRAIQTTDRTSFDAFRMASGKTLFFRTLLSASMNCDSAKTVGWRGNGMKIMFKITCADVQVIDEKPIFPVYLGDHDLSHFPDEEEVLFPLMTLFKVTNVSYVPPVNRSFVTSFFCANQEEMLTVELSVQLLPDMVDPCVLFTQM